MLGLSGDIWGAVGTLFGVGSAVVTGLYGRVSKADARAHELEIAAAKTEHAGEVAALRAEVKRVCEDGEGNAGNLRTAWAKIDELRENVVRKSELREYRAEVKQDMKDLGDRLERAIKDGIEAMRRQEP